MNRVVIFIVMLWLYGCANQTSPTGGPADKTPPELLSSSPRDNEKNFQGSTIQLLFNEEIKLKNAKEEILITPAIGKQSKFIVKGKRLIIEPELPWLINTTYSISLREGVADITEGNPTQNIRLAFSTGPTIDSLQIEGNVSYTFHEKKAEKITVAIFESDTFDIFTDSPLYFTYTDKEGNYLLKNIKSGNFFVYAFDDKNKNLKVESKSESFAFRGTSVSSLDTTKVNLALIKTDARPIQITAVRNSRSVSSVRFNKEIDSASITRNSNIQFLRYGSLKNELLIHHSLNENDSIKVKIQAIDSTSQQLDSTVYIKSTNQKLIDEQFKIKTIESNQDLRSKTYYGIFQIPRALSTINNDSILLKIDTAKIYKISRESIQYDTLNNLLKIKRPLLDTISSRLKPSIYFGSGALVTTQRDSSRRTTSAIKFSQSDQGGSLSFEITTKEPNFIVQILRDEKIQEELKGSTKSHTHIFSEPGNFKIRIIIDRNNNGKWDPGNFYLKEEPEKVIYYKNSEGKTIIPTRANWEVGPLMITF